MYFVNLECSFECRVCYLARNVRTFHLRALSEQTVFNAATPRHVRHSLRLSAV